MTAVESRTLRECAVHTRGANGAREFAPSMGAFTAAAALAVYGTLRFGQFLRSSVSHSIKRGSGRARLGVKMNLARGFAHLTASFGSLAAAYALWSFDSSSGAYATRRERADSAVNGCLHKILLLSVTNESRMGGEAAALLYAMDPGHPVLVSFADEVSKGPQKVAPGGDGASESEPGSVSGAATYDDDAGAMEWTNHRTLRHDDEEMGDHITGGDVDARGQDILWLRQMISAMPRMSRGQRGQSERAGNVKKVQDERRRGRAAPSSDDSAFDCDVGVMELLHASDEATADVPMSSDEVERQRRLERREQIIRKRKSKRRNRISNEED